MSKFNRLNIKDEKYQILLESISPKNLRKVNFHHNTLKNSIPPRFLMLVNIIIFSYIFLLLPEKILSEEEHYIQIKFNNIGESQVISSSYGGNLPYISGTDGSSQSRSVIVESIEDTIKLQWDEPLTDFSHMFENLENITSVEIINMFTDNIILSYMFKNCICLEYFSYDIDINESFSIKDMKEMFYGCESLTSVNFDFFYYDPACYDDNDKTTCEITYNNIDMSNMSNNCEQLESIDFGDGDIQYISNMNGMFYNCISLSEINLRKFKTENDNYIDLSFMFYNCRNLKSVQFPSTPEEFGVKDMEKIFYNCESLEQIHINKITKVSDNLIDMSRLFYNCINLANVIGQFNIFHISDTTEMFYNCRALNSLNFSPKRTNSNIKMTKMFYNCKNIKSIQLSTEETELLPIDMSEMFYNCITLKSLTINKFKTDNVKNMTYLLYNCYKLEKLDLTDSIFSNLLIKDMKGFFQNCESLVNLDLTNFYTPNVEIMWDMFKGCKSLQTLDVKNFDTSKVTDMHSMFEGCYNLKSLDLTHFNSSNVHYMNKMFLNCTNLESLYFNNLTSESLGTMQRMFYNCKNLKYLNMFLLMEDIQSINEIFKGSSDDIILCIKEDENIPNIYEILYKKENMKRDCSAKCYGEGEERIPAENGKKCCRNVKYNDKCYDKCPGRTNLSNTNTKECISFDCPEPNFYNFEQDDCYNSDKIPEGYYINDTDLRTIDKCDDNCKTCNNTSTYCTSCNDDMPYLYLNQCYNSCLYGYYNDSDGVMKCKCEVDKCFKCSKESLNKTLCESCNEGYYQKYNETHINNFVDCYKEPLEYYYLDSNQFMSCYYSCKYCYKSGNKQNHFCKSCNLKNNYPIQMVDYDNNFTYVNCYPYCTFNFYIDDEYNYICLKTSGCPSHSRLLIENTKQCVSSCKETKYKYEFRNTCFETCPPESTNFSNSTGDYCKSLCPFEIPFEMVENQICVASCTIIERYYKLCITNYKGNRTDEIQDMILTDI